MNTATTTSETTVGEVMTTNLVTVKLDDTLHCANDLLDLSRVRHLPVLDGDRVVGVIDENDLLRASMVSLVRHRQDGGRGTSDEAKVKAVMKPATMQPPARDITPAGSLGHGPNRPFRR